MFQHINGNRDEQPGFPSWQLETCIQLTKYKSTIYFTMRVWNKYRSDYRPGLRISKFKPPKTSAVFQYYVRLFWALIVKRYHKDYKNKSAHLPACLQTGPLAVRSGYVHLSSLHTGHLCAFVPVNTGQKGKKYEWKQLLGYHHESRCF